MDSPLQQPYACPLLIDKTQLTWTASRCHRLLRPLQNRIAALRRATRAQESACLGLSGSPPILTSNPSKKRNLVDTEHRQPAKQLRRTYSRKQTTGTDVLASKPRQSQRSKPEVSGHRDRQRTLGGPAPPTPIFRRTKLRESEKEVTTHNPKLGQLDSNICSKLRAAGGPTQNGPLHASINSLRSAKPQLDERRYASYEVIIRSLDALLHTTKTNSPPSSHKSLLSMCLRKIPEYTAGVEAWNAEEASKAGAASLFASPSATIRIYDDLEKMGCSGNGWKHLATVVRAHALWMLQEAIVEGLVEPTVAGILAHHYTQLGCLHDASKIIETTAARKYPAPRSSRSSLKEDGRLLPLSLLVGAAEQPGMAPRLVRSTASLLAEQLPSEWMSTKALSSFWRMASWAVSEPATSTCALEYVSAAIVALCPSRSQAQHPRTPQRQQCATGLGMPSTLASAVGALAAMAIMAQECGGFTSSAGGNASHSQKHTRKRVLHVLHDALTTAMNNDCNDDALYMLELATFLVSLPSLDGVQSDNDDMLDLRVHWPRGGRGIPKSPITGLYNATAALSCSIAHASGKAAFLPPNHFFSLLCDQFDAAGLPGLQGLRQDGAFLLAQRTHDLRDLAFAEGLGRVASSSSHPRMGPGCPIQATFVGYRWEEGISEWVVATPRRPGGGQRVMEPESPGPVGRQRVEDSTARVDTVVTRWQQENRGRVGKERTLADGKSRTRRRVLGEVRAQQVRAHVQAQARSSDDELGF